MTVVLDTPIAAGERLRTLGGYDDFKRIDTGEWTAVANTQKSAPNGVTLLSTVVSTDNSPASLARAYKAMQFRDDKPWRCLWLAKFTETVLNGITNLCIGVSNDTPANMLQNNGAGPPASWSGAVFYAVDGSPVLRCRSSVGTSYQETILSASDRNNLAKETILASNAAQRQFEIECAQVGPNDFHINFMIDRLLVAQHRLISTGAAAMGEVMIVKSGDNSANIQVLEIDMVDPHWVR
jgi:hypothetical protein